MSWNFQSTIKINNEEIKNDYRKFEYLVVDFLNSSFPMEHWKITSATSDNNRDAEHRCVMTGKTSWAEAKYTIHAGNNIGSRKYDSSLVSAVMDEYIIKIFFVTNASIGEQLISRVKRFFYVTKKKEIAFIDKAVLENWISSHVEIQQKYFTSWHQTVSTPHVSMRTLRVFHRVDSYTINSVLEFENFYPLYNINNYFFDVEFSILGFDKEPIQLYCNDFLLHDGMIVSGIHSFSIAKILEEILEQNLSEYKLEFWSLKNNRKVILGCAVLQFSFPPRIFKSQFDCYKKILNGLHSNGQIIYNIYGKKSSGKSWILQNIKEDLLRMSPEKKVIYINFSGNDTDLGDLCRIIFTLIFDYYNLTISAIALQDYIINMDYERSIYSKQNIKQLIEALTEENYDKIRNILMGAENGGNLFFEIADCYAWQKIYLIDNIHLLDSLCYSVLNTILKRFIPYKNVTFILSGREKLNLKTCKNIDVSFVENEELLYYINEITKNKINSLSEILPKDHNLFYPYLVSEFLQDIKTYGDSLLYITNYYTNAFINKVNLYKNGLLSIDEEDVLQVLICSVDKGIPTSYVLANFPNEHIGILLRDCIIKKGDYFFPDYNHISLQNLEFCIVYQKNILQKHLEALIQTDNTHSFRYIAVLIKYFYECHLKYYNVVFNEIHSLHNQNRYADMLYLCNALLYHEEWYERESHQLLEIKYLKAFGTMHCGTVSKALNIFEDVRYQYELYNFERDSLYYDTCAEIIDSEYWQLEHFTDLPYNINLIRKMWLTDSTERNLVKRPFFICMNRIMVVCLVNNKIKAAKKWFRKNMRTSAIPGLERRAGYTYMDFAKGIYHIDLNKSLSYLQAAIDVFNKFIKTEKRRYLDCLCEIEYVKLLLGTGSVQQFEKVRNQLFENEYWTQYYKAALKLSTYYALNGKIHDSKKSLMQAKNTFLLKNDTRCQYFIAILEAFLFKESPPAIELHIRNTSYNTILNHCKKHYKMHRAILYQKGTSAKGYYLDPRVW